MSIKGWIKTKLGLFSEHEYREYEKERLEGIRQKRLTDSNSLHRQRHLTITKPEKEVEDVSTPIYSPDEFGDRDFGNEWENKKDDND